MKKKENIVSFSAEELRAMVARGESKSDWARAAAMTYEEIEAAIASDPDEAGMEFDWTRYTTELPEPGKEVNWKTFRPELPQPKEVLNMRVDHDVMAFFRAQGKGYQTKINAVLRSYVDQMSRPGR